MAKSKLSNQDLRTLQSALMTALGALEQAARIVAVDSKPEYRMYSKMIDNLNDSLDAIEEILKPKVPAPWARKQFK